MADPGRAGTQGRNDSLGERKARVVLKVTRSRSGGTGTVGRGTVCAQPPRRPGHCLAAGRSDLPSPRQPTALMCTCGYPVNIYAVEPAKDSRNKPVGKRNQRTGELRNSTKPDVSAASMSLCHLIMRYSQASGRSILCLSLATIFV